MRLLHDIAIFQTVKSKVIISLFETVKLSVSISLRNLYNSLNSIKENYHLTFSAESLFLDGDFYFQLISFLLFGNINYTILLQNKFRLSVIISVSFDA